VLPERARLDVPPERVPPERVPPERARVVPLARDRVVPVLRELVLRELELRVPELREPVLREPELREPELREPELRDPELRDDAELRELVLRERALERLVPPLVPERDRVVVRRERRRVLARWSRGISARTISLTRRPSSDWRNLAIRSSSRRMLRASCAVSRSPTSVAKTSSRV
jgi:hypothetical protein